MNTSKEQPAREPQPPNANPEKDSGNESSAVRPVPLAALDNITRTAEEVGGPYEIPPDEIDAIGRTMFDSPQSQDNTVIILMPSENISQLPSQALVRIRSKGDSREYIA